MNVYFKAIQAIYNEALKRGIFKPTSFVSPFTGIKEKATPTKDKYLTLEEMKIITAKEVDHDYYRYFMLCFYLGGLDFVDIANIKKSHIRNGHIKFTRFKGGTDEIIDNRIFPEAQKILDYFHDPKNDHLTRYYKSSFIEKLYLSVHLFQR
ncbi:MAG TPA: hypothetical protein DD740_00435 [Chryseobacterium sp.]|nr:hypothetical protein [Chryseobacterium sp.]